jgi:hypothetical protein
MKTRLLLCSLACWLLGWSNGFAASYTIVIPSGLSPLVNQLDNGLGNTFSQLFPNTTGARDGDAILLHNCVSYSLVFFDTLSPTGFTDSIGNPVPEGSLPPGRFFFYLNNSGAQLVTFTGAPVPPVLPANLPCGCGTTNLMGRAIVGNGTYENVTGRTPVEGSEVQRWNGVGFVTNKFTGGMWSLGGPTILNVGEGAAFFVPCPDKWFQSPDVSTNGLDVRATRPKILADDFRCTLTGPITEIRVRGSWLNDLISTQACFCLGIWTDTPQQGTNFSRPNQQLCNWCFNPGQYSYSIYTNGVSERFYDPNLPGTNGYIGSDTVIWEYVFPVPTNAPPCIQTNGNIYWLSVSADCTGTNLFGWKTCPTNFNDNAVYGHVDVNNLPLMDWNKLERPPSNSPLDLSFTITTMTNRPPTIRLLDKWLQIPDTSTNGLDVRATKFKILADDFLCTNTGPITQIKVWGSWLDDKVPPAACFCLGIWDDVPASPTNLFSHPGEQRCSYCFNPGQYVFSFYTNANERFFDPNIPGPAGLIGSDTIIWEYDFFLTNACWQTNGNIYWLSVVAHCFDTNQYLFGWKTCPTNWNDDAVFGHVDFTNAPLHDWMDLKHPENYTNSLDLAFEILTETNICACTNGPIIVCPTNRVITACGSNVTWSVSATSACASVTVVSTPPSGTFFKANSTNTIVAVATDECGRTNSCSFQVIVRAPVLTIVTNTPGNITISWADGGVLQEATAMTGPWNDLPLATSPFTIAVAVPQKYYRLRCP